MKQFIGGLVFGIGIGLIICGLAAGSIVSDFEYTLQKYDTHIDNFYSFTHSYGFQAIQDITEQTITIYRTNNLLRNTLETFGLGQLGQLLQDVNDNFDTVITLSEDLQNARSAVREASSWMSYLLIVGIAFVASGILVAVWAKQ
jgi:hypothetical protein